MSKLARRLPRELWHWTSFGILITISVIVLMRIPPTRCGYSSPHARAVADIVSIDSAVMEYAIQHDGVFPRSLEELVAPDEHGLRYLASKSVPLDPWGHAYIYRPPTPSEPTPLLISLGRDGEIGGHDEDADIDSVTISTQ